MSKRERLRLRSDYSRAFKGKCAVGDDLIVVYVVRNHLAWSRLGRSVSRRVGVAVRRNYVRRCIRETFRKSKELIPKGFDFVCVAKPPAADPSSDLSDSLVELTNKAVRRLKAQEPGNKVQWRQDAAVS